MIPSSGLLGSAHLVNISNIQHQLLNIEESTKWAIHWRNSADIWWLDSNDHTQHSSKLCCRSLVTGPSLGSSSDHPLGPAPTRNPFGARRHCPALWDLRMVVSPRVGYDVCCLQYVSGRGQRCHDCVWPRQSITEFVGFCWVLLGGPASHMYMLAGHLFKTCLSLQYILYTSDNCTSAIPAK